MIGTLAAADLFFFHKKGSGIEGEGVEGKVTKGVMVGLGKGKKKV